MSKHFNILLLAVLFSSQLVLASETTGNFRVHTVPNSSPELATVPDSAIVIRNGIPGVFVLQRSLARFIMVKTGKRQNKKIEILSGLLPGDQVILGQLDALHDGSPVNVQNQ